MKEEKVATQPTHGNASKGRRNTSRWSNSFKGETADMNGNVFQLQSENTKKGQFDDTLDALQRYAAKAYPMDSVALLPIFTDLKQPTIKAPEKPKPVIKKESDEDDTYDEWDKIMYIEAVKLHLKSKERVESTLTSLYGVAWGQCSRLMQNKCKSDKYFNAIEKECDLVSLLKIIKTPSHEFESHTCVWDALSQAKRRFYSYK